MKLIEGQKGSPEIPQKEWFKLIVKFLDVMFKGGSGLSADIRDELDKLGLFKNKEFVAELISAENKALKFVPKDIRTEAVEDHHLKMAEEIKKKRKELAHGKIRSVKPDEDEDIE